MPLIGGVCLFQGLAKHFGMDYAINRGGGVCLFQGYANNSGMDYAINMGVFVFYFRV